MADKPERVEIGFSGGQVIAVRLTPANIKKLRTSLEGKDGWGDVDTADGAVAVDFSQVIFIRSAAGENAIGFGG